MIGAARARARVVVSSPVVIGSVFGFAMGYACVVSMLEANVQKERPSKVKWRMRARTQRSLCSFMLPMFVGWVVVPSAVKSQPLEFLAPSRYWCDKVGGTVSGSAPQNQVLCHASYMGQTGACDLFRQHDDGDPVQRKALDVVGNTRVCLSETIVESKKLSLRYRIEMMRYVTAGREEKVNDPIHGFRPKSGETGGRAAQFSLYALHQCIVETCERK
jgi:hypothetical protein